MVISKSTETNKESKLEGFRKQIVGLDREVPLWDGSSKRHVNFDNDANTNPLEPVAGKVNHFLGWYSSVHRGSGLCDNINQKLFRDIRQIS